MAHGQRQVGFCSLVLQRFMLPRTVTVTPHPHTRTVAPKQHLSDMSALLCTWYGDFASYVFYCSDYGYYCSSTSYAMRVGHVKSGFVSRVA